MTKIKIVHLLHSIGGVDVYLRLVLEHTNIDLFENTVIHGTKDTNKSFFDKNGNKVKEYKISIFRNISIVNDIKSIVQTYKILKKEKPNLIHAHSAKGGILGRIVGKTLGIKVIYTPHAFSYLSTQNRMKRTVFLTIERFLANGKSILLTTSESEKKRGINEVGYKEDKIIVFNNCIEPIPKIESLTIHKTWPDEYICTVGRPSYQKNIELMIRVLYEVKKTRKIHLIVMGVGPVSDQLESVKNLIQKLEMSQDITLLDWTERTDVFNIINQSKFYISTARYEGMPYAIIESLALSKACIVTNCDGNRDLIIDGFNGYLVEQSNINSFKDKIITLLESEKLLDTLSKNAYKSFSKNYNIIRNINQLEAIYIKYH